MILKNNTWYLQARVITVVSFKILYKYGYLSNGEYDNNNYNRTLQYIGGSRKESYSEGYIQIFMLYYIAFWEGYESHIHHLVKAVGSGKAGKAMALPVFY